MNNHGDLVDSDVHASFDRDEGAQNNDTPGTMQNGGHFTDDIFKRIFYWRYLCFDLNFTESCSWWSNWYYVSIGSGNGLSPIRQAIAWTHDDPIYCRKHMLNK